MLRCGAGVVLCALFFFNFASRVDLRIDPSAGAVEAKTLRIDTPLQVLSRPAFTLALVFLLFPTLVSSPELCRFKVETARPNCNTEVCWRGTQRSKEWLQTRLYAILIPLHTKES